MPLVERGADVTLVVLVYRSTRWLDWVMEGVERSQNEARYKWMVVANDATPEVLDDPRVCVQYDNEDPSEFYINRVYRAWNAGVLEATTDAVVMLNTDMWGADGWLDSLLVAKSKAPLTVPTSLLVESGRLESAMPAYVKNFGQNPDEFDAEGFRRHGNALRSDKVSEGRLFMPILVSRSEFFDIGAYPEGNPPGTTGDKDLIRRYAEAGFKHTTVHGSVVYHVQLGEQEWP